MSVLSFVFQGVFPVFLLIVSGWYLKKRKFVDQGFLSAASKVGFRLGLPSLVFLKVAPLDFDRLFDPREILLVCLITLGAYLLSFLLSLRIPRVEQRGAFTQGAFRGNVAIIGMALILNLYGEEMLARSAMILAFLLPIFNIFSVIALTVPLHGFTPKGLTHSLSNILRNPIILAVAAGIAFSLLKIPVPQVISRYLGYLAAMALPLALITIGGTLSYQGMKTRGRLALGAVAVKLLLLPAAGALLFYRLGYRGEELGMIFLILGAPTAVSSHVMAEAMENDGELAALIVMLTTVGSALTTMVGIGLIAYLS